MKQNLIKCIVLGGLFFVIEPAFAQNQSIGVRLGNPIGVTYKRNISSDRALEFLIGSASPAWSSNYYKHSFSAHNRYDDYSYRSHRTTGTVYFQGRYLFEYNIPVQGMIGRLGWYWGLGAMLKIATVEYTYQQGDATAVLKDEYTDLDIGPEALAGMSYVFEDVPLELFGEVSLLIELADRPLTLRAFGGVGVRYRF
jgi:hypothetical protein